ncbi:MAG: GDSL-type esterase/lipase family protein [Steroidobacteraceae bacterium]
MDRIRGRKRAWVAAAGCLMVFMGACGAAPSAPSVAPTPLERELGAEVAQFAAADKLSFPAPCQVLFVGSSSIRMWKTLSQDMAPMPVINRGFGGSEIEYVNRWFDPLVAAYRPRAIVFYAGENDVDSGKSTQRVLADFDVFLEKKAAALGAVPVYFISLKPSKLRIGQLAQQAEVNAAIRALVARRTDLHYIDVATPMLENGQPRDLYAADGLHMTRDGYAIWTQRVRAALPPQPGSCQPMT